MNQHLKNNNSLLKYNPKVSIICVAYNPGDRAKITFDSIAALSYSNKEVILIDNCSDAYSLRIYEDYKSLISVYCSEPDLGIYDAMNKGVSMASGDWIWFMNMGDTVFENKDMLKIIFNQAFSEEVLVLFGNVFVFKSNLRYIKVFHDKVNQNVSFGILNLNHQSMLIKKRVFNEFGYFAFQDFKIKADAYLLTKILKYKGNKSFYHVGLIMSKYNEEGISSNPANFKRMQEEDRLIISKLGSKIQFRLYILYCYFVNLKIAIYPLLSRNFFLIKLYHRIKYGFQAK